MTIIQIRDLKITCEDDYVYGEYTAYIDGVKRGRWHIEEYGGLTLNDLRGYIARQRAIHESFNCLDCGDNTSDIHEYYTVHDEVWLTAHPDDEGMLCIGCLENRLGRVLTPDDFPEYPINTTGFFNKSDRLRERLGHEAHI